MRPGLNGLEGLKENGKMKEIHFYSPQLLQTNKKNMMIVFFSFQRIVIADFLPNGEHINSTYFCDHILSGLDEKI